jgi:WD40 repeat protein/tRNA A-37 threonylcarbamoyl transferase component Bud32
MTDRIGQQFGNYLLIRFLGKGSFAEVYLGEHVYLKTQAAIKILQMRLAADNLDGFLNEARTIARLEHPHIVHVFDFGVKDTIPFLVMSYASNGTLRQRHPKDTTLSLATITFYIKQATDALQYAHDEKLIHRDIKPENLLLGRSNEILLSDFGLALVAQSSGDQSTQMFAGTVAYMAPEQIQGKPRPASDQYALGIIVYEWLSGARPFYGSLIELCTQHIYAPPPPLHEKVSGISPAVEEVVLTALAKDPRQRFASVRAFATALEQAAWQESPRLKPVVVVSPHPSTPTLSTPEPLHTPVLTPSAPASLNTSVPDPAMLPVFATLTPSNSAASSLARFLSQRRISRRLLLGGLGLAGSVAAGGGIIWWILSQQSRVGQAQQGPRPYVGQVLYIYRGHPDYVAAVTWSPYGKRIASGGADITVQVWDATTGGHVLIYRGHRDVPYSVAWSPDGQHIASGSADRTVQVWNATTGALIFTYQHHSDTVNAVAWSPDGKRIASASYDNTVQVWDATTGNTIVTYRGHNMAVSAVTWSPDDKHIASASLDHTVQVWDATNGSHILTYSGHSSEVNAVTWSPDGKYIASGSGNFNKASADHTVQVWQVANGGHILTYSGHSAIVYAVAWSPDGKHIASGSGDKTVQVWDATTGNHTLLYHGHSAIVYALAWSPDGQRIVSGGTDSTAQVWQAI